MSAWLVQGRIDRQEAVCEALENAPRTCINLMKATNIGKVRFQLRGPSESGPVSMERKLP